ncbi:hypothetical protein MK852_13340 [Shewanella benthica]|uniref:hypothetical protein n=1 Tax=Shewanella TaxID=22 RepID=UPI000C0C9E56|nr:MULTISPECIES: hypothetical protein [Shewanella]MBE7216151.1 hypothetical protein [Shewanella benthica]MBL4814623.1 hypothetical protein [Shewanella sp.]MCJ8304358.1 hypothetical protein [Shewanella sp.]MCL1063109.1 hypothetical protein [Shewanella benthica]PHQ76499.1 MAG: hypothetical protein COB74_01570 [Shewanella sp.]
MKNKLLLSTLITSTLLLSSQAGATQTTGTANFNLVYPITVTEATAMEFGDIDVSIDGTCALDYANATTGASCIAGGATAASGDFTITAANGIVNITLSGADTSVAGVTFTPTIASSTVTVAANTASLKVGGTVAVVAASASAGAHALSYTVDVIY